MARIRTIKPEFWTSEQVTECSVSARLLFIGLWNFADDGGNLSASCKTAKMQVFPADNIDVEPLIKELLRKELLIEYCVNGRNYWHITGWKHQVINRPSPLKHPEYSSSSHVPLSECSQEEGKGKEGKGKEEREETFPHARKRASRLPNDWVLPPEYRDFALGEKFSSDHINSEAEKFADYWRGNGVAKADWLATWRNWIRRSNEFKNSNTQKPASQQRFMR